MLFESNVKRQAPGGYKTKPDSEASIFFPARFPKAVQNRLKICQICGKLIDVLTWQRDGSIKRIRGWNLEGTKEISITNLCSKLCILTSLFLSCYNTSKFCNLIKRKYLFI